MEEKSKQSPERLKIERIYQRKVAVVEAKPFFKRIFLAIWLGADIILLLIFIGYLIFFAIVGFSQTEEQVARVENNIESTRAISIERAARPLGIETARVLTSTDGTYDLYATIENPNEHWYAEFSYRFSASQGETKSQSGFIMPKESKPIVAFAQEFGARPIAPEVVIENLTWHRVDAGKIENISVWLTEHKRFKMDEAVHGMTVALEGERIPHTSFQLTNDSAFRYWSPSFYVILGRVDAPSAVNTITVPGFEAGETRQVEINWFGSVPGSATIELVPNINFFDESVYMEVSPGADMDIRDQF